MTDKLRKKVEKKLGHSDFQLTYAGDGNWNIFELASGRFLGWIEEGWPYKLFLITERKRFQWNS